MGSTHLGRWVGGGLDEYGRPVFDGMDVHGYWAEEEASRAIQVPCATGSGSGLAPAIVVGAAISGTVAQGAGAVPVAAINAGCTLSSPPARGQQRPTARF